MLFHDRSVHRLLDIDDPFLAKHHERTNYPENVKKKKGKNGNAVCSTRYHSHGALSREKDRSRMADLLSIMVESPDLAAKALNRLTNEVFTDVLTDRDRGLLSDLVHEFSFSAPDPSDADDSGKLAMNNDNINEYSQELCTLRILFWSLGLWNLGGGAGPWYTEQYLPVFTSVAHFNPSPNHT